MRRLCVFCGSRNGADPAFADAARRLGTAMARKGVGLVYGGGGIGLMGVVADAVLEAGGEAIGVIPHALEEKELGHARLTEKKVVGSMHERKALMASLADAFVALPGGMGTLDELCEIVTWAQLGIHQKPCALLDVGGYWDSFLAHLDRAVAAKFLEKAHRDMILVESEPERLLERLIAGPPPPPGWIDPREV